MTVRAPGARSSLIVLCLAAFLAATPASHASPTPAPAALVRAPLNRSPLARRAARLVPTDALDQSGAPALPARSRQWWGWVLLGRLHPMVVHFPIALLSAAALIELLHLFRRKPVPSEAGTYCLALGVVGALASVGLGTLNAGQQMMTGDAAAALERHQVMGWISTIAAMAALAAGVRARRARQVRTVAAYVGLVLATGAVVSATGHLGGGLVYGEDYLTGVLPWNQGRAQVGPMAGITPAAGPRAAAAPMARAADISPPVAIDAHDSGPRAAAHAGPAARDTGTLPVADAQAAEAVDFMRDVMPIIQETCVECHGPEKVKARLRMDSIEGLQKGGKSGALVKPGDPENSLMLRRVLGLDGEDQMPLDKDPLSEKQIDTLRRWVAAGATYPAAASQ